MKKKDLLIEIEKLQSTVESLKMRISALETKTLPEYPTFIHPQYYIEPLPLTAPITCAKKHSPQST